MKYVSTIIDKIIPENKIGEGTYRNVYRISPDLCAKVLKLKHKKNYNLFEINYNAQLYTQLKFGIANFNEQENINYTRIKHKIPKDLASSFAKIHGLFEDYLIEDFVLNENETISKTLHEHESKITNPVFWKKLYQIRDFFIDERIHNFNINPDNVLIKQIDSKQIPVITDYKRIGPSTYPFQPQLRIRHFAEEKLKRRFERLKKEYS